MAKFDAVLQRIIRLLFLGLFFCLPLIFWIPNSEVFELPKMYFVYAATALIAGLWTARMIVRREILISKTPLDIPILLFLLSQIASTIYSIDPHVSWFGWYGRFNGGLLSTISYTVLYYAFVSNSSVIGSPFSVFGFKSIGYQSISRKPINRQLSNQNLTTDNRGLITAILASATIVSLYALLQHFGIDRDFWVQDVMNRVFSTQGQPNWLAAYLVIVIPLAWTAAISDFRFQISDFKKLFLNLNSYILILIFFLSLLFTKSRSGLLGFAVADAVFWLARFAKKEPRIKSQESRKFLLVHSIIILLILFTDNPVKKIFLTPYSLLPTSSPTKSELGGTESGDIRKLVWSGAIKIAKQNPIFGTGPETFGLTYWQVRPKEANLTSEWNFLYNKAHNEWLNSAANTGMFGLISHLLLVGWFFVFAIRYPLNDNRKEKTRLTISDSRLTVTAFLAAVLGLETVNFFGFSTVTTETYRYLFMGMGVMIGTKDKGQRLKEKSSPLSPQPLALSLILFLAILYLLSQISSLFRADLNYNRGRQFYSAGVVGEAINPLYRAVELAPNEPVFRNELAEALSAAAISIWADGDKNQAVKIKNEAVTNFKIASGQSKFNLTFMRTQAQMEFLMREIDPSLTDESLKLAKKTIDLSPTDPRGYYLLGRMYEELGEKTKAKDLYLEAVKLKPDYGEAKRLN